MHQGTQEWVNWRKGKIGASDAPSILGVGYHTPRQLWEIKLGLRDVEMNPAMLAGKRLEESVRRWYETSTGNIMWPCCMSHPQYEWMIASFDGLSDDGQIALEIKVLGREKHQQVKDGIVPDCYYPQVQHQCAVGAKTVKFVSYNEQMDDYAVVSVERDDAYVSEMIPQLEHFYEYLTSQTPPPMSSKDKLFRDDDEFRLAVERMSICKQHLNKAQEEYDNAHKELISLCDCSCEGFGYSVSKEVHRGKIDYKKIPELKHVDTSKFRRPSSTRWVVRELNEKEHYEHESHTLQQIPT